MLWTTILNNRYVQGLGAVALFVFMFATWLWRHDKKIEDKVEDEIIDRVREEQKEISQIGREVLELKLGQIKDEPIEIKEPEPIEVVDRNSDTKSSSDELRESNPRLASILFD
jgi:hypothetical protein